MRLEIPRVVDPEDANGRTLAYDVWLDADGDGFYERLFNIRRWSG